MYHVFYEDIAGCGRAVLMSDSMNITIKPTFKHEGLLWLARGVVTMGNMVYKTYVTLNWHMGWWCYSQTQMLRSVASGWIWALIKTPETSNALRRHMCFEVQGLLDDMHQSQMIYE